MAVRHFSHVGLCVSDLEASLSFYCDGLGFRRLHSLEVSGQPLETLVAIPSARLEAVFLERDGTRIELLHYLEPGTCGSLEPAPMNRLGLTHLSLRVDDLDASVDRLRLVGARVLDASRVWNPDFQAGAIFVCDPDGLRVELVQSPGDPSKLPGA
jgi:catechol 2,3-dioxygenase-like lactoylglutathione lyase family enzyme